MAGRTDFRLYHGNDLSVLAAVLAAELAKAGGADALLQPDTIVIPQPAMKRWLQNALAEAHGIAANLRFITPGEFVRETLDANLAEGDDAPLADAAMLRWRLWQQLRDPSLLQQPVFTPLRPLLSRADAERAAWALAGELAKAFEKYQAWRRDWLIAWDRGAAAQDWQAELWRRVSRGRSHRAARLQRYLTRYGDSDGELPAAVAARTFAFACQNISPDVLRVMASSARAGTLHFFFFSPVASWWGDLQTVSERLRMSSDAVFAADEETPLLRANGAAGRDFVRLLFSYEVVHPNLDLPIYAPPDPATRRGLLHRLQRDLLHRQGPRNAATIAQLPRFDIDTRDASLQVHACATPLRELQVLHDQLRALLEADTGLQPRDIAVLAPDIDGYAPHVHAVFSAGDAGFTIPYAVADARVATSVPLAAAFLRWLQLPQSRFGVNDVLELLALPAVAEQLQLNPIEFERVREWLLKAGARWGLDAAHRVDRGAPEESAYTWAWALQRLLLGHATGDDMALCGVAPLPLIEGSALLTLDGLMRGLRVLARLRQTLAQPRSAAQWQFVLLQALEDLVPASPAQASDRRALQQLRTLLQDFGEQAAHAGIEGPVPPEVMRDWFTEALSEADARQPFLTGGVTFARMVPMRLIPFRVICVLGLNDAAFPRSDVQGGLNRIDAALGGPRRRIGDRSLRDDDRALFLQLFGAATDTFYLSYLGRDPASGEIVPPSVVVSELLDAAAASFSNPDDAREQLVVRQPLHPFAAEAFGRDDPRRFSYRSEWRIDSAPTCLPAAPFASALPGPDKTGLPTELDLSQLQRELRHPLRTFLRQRLGIQLDTGTEQLPQDEPFGSDDALRRHGIKQRLFAQLAASDELPSVEELSSRLLAQGWIAPAAAGVAEVGMLRNQLLQARLRWREWAVDEAVTCRIEHALDGLQLGASLGPVHRDGLLQFRAGKGHGRTRIDLALERLLWSASGETRSVHRLVLEQGTAVTAALAPSTAHAALQSLLALRALMLEQALPLMPNSAWNYAEKIYQGASDERAFAAARSSWCDGPQAEGRDPWVRLALRGKDPFAEPDSALAHQFRELAMHLFDALHEAGVQSHAL